MKLLPIIAGCILSTSVMAQQPGEIVVPKNTKHVETSRSQEQSLQYKPTIQVLLEQASSCEGIASQQYSALTNLTEKMQELNTNLMKEKERADLAEAKLKQVTTITGKKE